MCLEGLTQRVGSMLAEGKLVANERPKQVELVFRALRALSPLQVDAEIELLRDSGCQVTTKAATTQNLRALIASADCKILHLSLHCSAAQEHLLFLEDGFGKAHVIRAEELKSMLSQGQLVQTMELVFVNACHSLALGRHFLEAGVRHVVCVKDEEQVRDESCRLFARDFFAALRAGRSVQESFECGRAVLHAVKTRSCGRMLGPSCCSPRKAITVMCLLLVAPSWHLCQNHLRADRGVQYLLQSRTSWGARPTCINSCISSMRGAMLKFMGTMELESRRF